MSSRWVGRLVAIAALAAIALATYWYSTRDTEHGSASPTGAALEPKAPGAATALDAPERDARAELGSTAAKAPETAQNPEAGPPPTESPVQPAAVANPNTEVLAESVGYSPLAPASGDADPAADPDGFAVKYAGYDVARYKDALDTVESVLTWQYQGRFDDKSQALPAEALQALERERVWLKERAFP